MINQLIDNPNVTVIVQDTAFSTDAMGRYICNTWEEATGNVANGGFPFDVVVIGAGMYGAYCAEKIYRASGKAKRILVLEAGPFLVSEHVQNLTRMGLNPGGAVIVAKNADDPGTRERVWGSPWRSNTAFPGLAFCIGGRSLYWGGWSPALTPADLAQWPPVVAADIVNTYPAVRKEIGTDPTTDYISGPLFQELFNRCTAVQGAVPTVDAIEEAPLAVQGTAPASGLFSFDKYSSAPILIDAIREDSQGSFASLAASPDSARQLFLVPRAHVIRLITSGGAVTQLELAVNGQRKNLAISPDCAVVLALSTVECTRLALESFPTPLMGRNLMVHLRSNTTVRIKRTAFSPTLPKQLEAAALLVRGSTPQGRYHLQVTAAAVLGANPESVMWTMVPDVDVLSSLLASEGADSIVITFRGIGETSGNKSGMPPDRNWVDLSPDQTDEFQAQRAWVNLVRTPDDDLLWRAMDDTAIALAKKLANDDPNNIEYFYKQSFLNDPNDPGAWNKTPPPPSPNNDPNDARNKVRDGLGTTHHEAGTLWMGSDPATSVTDLSGRFHHISNAYVAGPALFPALGSANPSLTAFSLARRTAGAIVQESQPAVEAGFVPLCTGANFADWQMAGFGRFTQVGQFRLQSEGGIGLLWYTKEQFGDFNLRLDWRACIPTDNSGVFIRFPALGKSDPANDWRLAVDKGYEIQIDDTGFNPDTGKIRDTYHQTGAIYTFAPSSQLASLPIGQWNTYEIEARGQNFKVTLNGILVATYTGDGSRSTTGYIGLQNHHQGSRIQFRNIRIKKM